MVSSSKRKMLAARDDLVDKVGRIAANKGFTLFGMVNNLLELAVQAEDLGISLDEAMDKSALVKAVREVSYTLLLESLLYDTVEIAYQNNAEKTLQTWFDAGVWVAKRYISRREKDPLLACTRDLKVFGWNISEVNFERSGNRAYIRILSPRFTEAYTALLSRYLEGMLGTLGYIITYKEIGRGNVRLEAVEKVT